MDHLYSSCIDILYDSRCHTCKYNNDPFTFLGRYYEQNVAGNSSRYISNILVFVTFHVLGGKPKFFTVCNIGTCRFMQYCLLAHEGVDISIRLDCRHPMGEVMNNCRTYSRRSVVEVGGASDERLSSGNSVNQGWVRRCLVCTSGL